MKNAFLYVIILKYEVVNMIKGKPFVKWAGEVN